MKSVLNLPRGVEWHFSVQKFFANTTRKITHVVNRLTTTIYQPLATLKWDIIKFVILVVAISATTTTSLQAQTLDQDAFAVEKGPHFFNDKCCFCKEVTSVQMTTGGYMFFLVDGRELFVDQSMVKPSVDGKQWYCPAYGGENRCGLILVGS